MCRVKTSYIFQNYFVTNLVLCLTPSNVLSLFDTAETNECNPQCIQWIKELQLCGHCLRTINMRPVDLNMLYYSNTRRHLTAQLSPKLSAVFLSDIFQSLTLTDSSPTIAVQWPIKDSGSFVLQSEHNGNALYVRQLFTSMTWVMQFQSIVYKIRQKFS